MIAANKLRKHFGRDGAIDGLSFSVPEGSAFALIGANGAGKTTTIKLLMNILQPSGGNATVLGVDSRRLSAKEFGRIGYVSENQQMPLFPIIPICWSSRFRSRSKAKPRFRRSSRRSGRT
jgi:ABC-2 type transport system ATP-binding protein